MTITYQVEKWADALQEMEPIFVQHWREIALGHDKVPLDIARDKYQELCDAGVLHIVTIRNGEILVGYHIGMVSGHLHYLSTIHAMTDIYYILPEYRLGRIAIKLFQRVEKEMRLMGVKKLYTGCKLHTADGKTGRLFDYLGYKAVETMYTKYIGV